MKAKKFKISLRVIVLLSLLAIGIVPVLTVGWILSDRSGEELRLAEGRYQTQLVQDRARQIEMFGQANTELVLGFANAFEFAGDPALFQSEKTESNMQKSLKEHPGLVGLVVKPIQGDELSVYRKGALDGSEVKELVNSVVSDLSDRKVTFGNPTLIKTSGKMVIPVASPIYIDGKLNGAMIALASFSDISISTVDASLSESEMWEAGIPIIFIVDSKGIAVSHPNESYITTRRSLENLKIVQDWIATRDQIQSALVPFNAERDGAVRSMIGAYSTADFGSGQKFGVIVMQDADKALASVGEMRTQVWFISILIALVALVLGWLISGQLALPLSGLVDAAKKIAAGDLSHRITEKRLTEVASLGSAFNSMSDDLSAHIEDLANAAKENKELFVGTVKALAAAIDGKDRYTRGHSERVSRVSVAIGQRLNMDEEELEKLRISALLHDVGKIGIDDAILKKPAALTDEEYEIMKSHPQQGYKIMKNIPAMKEFLPGMYMHHEMVNGKGYPQGLKDEEIPLQAKIVSVADTFDAMTIDRPYQKGMKLPDALERIKSFVGTRYDLKVVDALIRACADGQIGVGTVKLRNHSQKGKPRPSKVA